MAERQKCMGTLAKCPIRLFLPLNGTRSSSVCCGTMSPHFWWNFANRTPDLSSPPLKTWVCKKKNPSKSVEWHTVTRTVTLGLYFFAPRPSQWVELLWSFCAEHHSDDRGHLPGQVDIFREPRWTYQGRFRVHGGKMTAVRICSLLVWKSPVHVLWDKDAFSLKSWMRRAYTVANLCASR